MSTSIIPTQTSQMFWNQTTTLDGVPYFLLFQYNSREACYYLQIQSADQSITYAQGIKLVSNYPLLGFGVYAGYAGPPGELIVVSASHERRLAGGVRRDSVTASDASSCTRGGGHAGGGSPGRESWRNPDGTLGL